MVRGSVKKGTSGNRRGIIKMVRMRVEVWGKVIVGGEAQGRIVARV